LSRPGFTLIELLLAFTLLAIISGGLALAFSTSLRAAGAIHERGEAADERRALVERLRADLEGAWLRPGSQTTWFRGSDAGTIASTSASAEGDVLELTTTRLISPELLESDMEMGAGPNPQSAIRNPQSDVAQVSWRLERGADGEWVLMRRERVPPDATRFATPEEGDAGTGIGNTTMSVDETQDPAVVPMVMSRLATGLTVRFFDGTEWLDEWDSTVPLQTGEADGLLPEGVTQPESLPMAVEVTISFGDEAAIAEVGRDREESSSGVAPLTLVVALPASQPASPLAAVGGAAAGGATGAP
jgi:prepilin-type N-terminal cleavage/methylation domain-containing protein